MWLRRGDVPTTRIFTRLSEYLELSPEQREKARDILEKANGELGESVGSLRELGEKTREKLRAILTDAQREKLDKLRNDMRDTAERMAQNYGPALREGAERLGQEVRFRMALRGLDLTPSATSGVTIGLFRMALRGLDLTHEQREKVEAIEKETAEKIRAIQEEVRPKIQAARQEAVKKIEDVLTPEQREKFQNELKKFPAENPSARRGAAPPPAEKRESGPQAFGAPRPMHERQAYLPPRPPAPAVGFRQEVPPLAYGAPAPPMEPRFAPQRAWEPDPRMGPVPPPPAGPMDGEVPAQPAAPPRERDILTEIFG
jgi:Spy/CpxP family protein refolding chaperone